MSVLTKEERTMISDWDSVVDMRDAKSIIDRLAARVEELQEERADMAQLLEEFIDYTVVPDANCSCHLSPPCSDCVEYSQIRDFIEQANTAVQKAKEGND